jgi:hypothetical protein
VTAPGSSSALPGGKRIDTVKESAVIVIDMLTWLTLLETVQT